MASELIEQPQAHAHRTVTGQVALPRTLLPVLGAIATGWAVVAIAQLTGNAGALHHHALIEGGLPLWVAILAFLLAWQVMIAAMMLPASLLAIRSFALAPSRRPGLGLAAFLAGYAVVWTGFGLAAFMGDVVVHHLVDATPWLGARPWLIEAIVLSVAGCYQLLPVKRHGLAACRHPVEQTRERSLGPPALSTGFRHGVECLASSWALMLVMFAAGFANLWWMAVLAALMAYETTGRHGQRAVAPIGAALLGLAGLVAVTGWVPGTGTA